jgi:hypothetical protein
MRTGPALPIIRVIVRVRQRRPCGEPFQPADVRQRLFADFEPDCRRLEERVAALKRRAALAAATGMVAQMLRCSRL